MRFLGHVSTFLLLLGLSPGLVFADGTQSTVTCRVSSLLDPPLRTEGTSRFTKVSTSFDVSCPFGDGFINPPEVPVGALSFVIQPGGLKPSGPKRTLTVDVLSIESKKCVGFENVRQLSDLKFLFKKTMSDELKACLGIPPADSVVLESFTGPNSFLVYGKDGTPINAKKLEYTDPKSKEKITMYCRQNFAHDSNFVTSKNLTKCTIGGLCSISSICYFPGDQSVSNFTAICPARRKEGCNDFQACLLDPNVEVQVSSESAAYEKDFDLREYGFSRCKIPARGLVAAEIKTCPGAGICSASLRCQAGDDLVQTQLNCSRPQSGSCPASPLDCAKDGSLQLESLPFINESTAPPTPSQAAPPPKPLSPGDLRTGARHNKTGAKLLQ